jgi:RNA polymerase sigma-70 factor (ECF subfamily)
MAQSEIFARELLPHRDALRRTARRLGRQDAEDLVQETYLRALVAERCYQPGSNAGAWLHRILVNTAVSEHRRSARDRRLRASFAAEPRTAAWVPTEPVPGLDELPDALSALAPHERRVIELADLGGLRYRDVARTLGCPIGTVMSRLYRARRSLRRALEAQTASPHEASGSATSPPAP